MELCTVTPYQIFPTVSLHPLHFCLSDVNIPDRNIMAERMEVRRPKRKAEEQLEEVMVGPPSSVRTPVYPSDYFRH